MNDIRKNYLYSIILTISNYFFPLIIYPYITRVLGVNNIGICSYVDSIVNYLILLSMMGISYVGIRAIAQNKNNQQELNKVFSNLFYINIVLTIIVLTIFNVSIVFIPKFHEYLNFIIIGEVKIILNILLIEWFYQGYENFKYITIRSVAVKIIYLVLIFIFIKNENDVFLYYIFTLVLVGGNFIFNWFHKNKYVKLQWVTKDIFIYVKSVFVMGVYTIFTSFYATFNIILLGYISGTIQVGYYSTALKIFEIAVGVFTAFSKVMLPHISSIIKNNIDLVFDKLFIIIKIVFFFVIPLVFVIFTFAPEIVFLISGDEFKGSIIPLRILSFLFIPFTLDQILVLQLLLPMKQDKSILKNSLIASIIAIILIFYIIPPYGSIGSAIILLTSEVLIMIMSIYVSKKRIGFVLPIKDILNRLIFAIPYIIISYVGVSILNNWQYRLHFILVSSLLYFLYEFFYTKCSPLEILKNRKT